MCSVDEGPAAFRQSPDRADTVAKLADRQLAIRPKAAHRYCFEAFDPSTHVRRFSAPHRSVVSLDRFSMNQIFPG